MLKLISNNPFRILGVFANGTMKEIVSNLNKAQAFIKIGQTTKFPSDFDLSQFNNGQEDNLRRNTDSLNIANKAIERTDDKLKAWMFWFINQTPIDNIAFNHIKSGDFDVALEIWTKVDNLSSLHNRILVYLLKNDWYNAAITAGKYYTDFSVEICSYIDETLKLDSEELLNLFFSSIEAESSWVISLIYSNLQKNGFPHDYFKWGGILEKIYANQEIELLNKSIAKSKAEDRKDSKLMRFYAEVYTNNGNLHTLDKLLGKEKQEYISIASKVASEALQCVIDYYNNSLDQDDIAEDTLELMNKVLSIAPEGSMARHHCQENIEKIRNIIDKLPPKLIRYYHKLLQARIDAYDNEASTIRGASQFLKDCAPYLMSIKNIIGASHEYYIVISTRVASAIVNDIIEDFNNKSEHLRPRIKSSFGNHREALLEQFKEVLKSATILMYQLQYIGMDPEFKEKRYQPNYITIKEQAKSARVICSNSFTTWAGLAVSEFDFISAISKYALDNRDEKGYYKTCRSTGDCYEYLRIFPNGKYAKNVKQKIEGFAFNECKTLEDLNKFIDAYPKTNLDVTSKKEEIIFRNAHTVDDLHLYLALYPKGKFKAQALQKIDDLKFNNCTTKLELYKYISDFPDGSHHQQAYQKIDDIDFRDCKSIADFERYLIDYPHGAHVTEAKDRLDEEKLWEQCIQKNSWKLYKKYLRRYPDGKHSLDAKPKSKSPGERLKEWRSNNGCLFSLIIIVPIILLIAGIINGLLGISYVFLGIGAMGVFGSMGKGDLGCNFRIAALSIGLASGLIGIGIIQIGAEIERKQNASSAYEELGENPSISEYQSLCSRHYADLDNEKKEELVSRYYNASLDSCYSTLNKYSAGGYNSPLSGLGYLSSFIDKCPNGTYHELAKSKYDFLIDSLYTVAIQDNTYKSWELYQNSVPTEEYKDSEERMQASDNKWNTEPKAWQTASTLDNLEAYRKYMTLFPNGKHYSQADKKIIDLSVTAAFASEHGSLPAMDKTSYGHGSTSSISVYNKTSYTLTLLYSGPESKRLSLSPYGRGTVKLKNGSYRVAASASSSSVQNYAGTENFDGGSYEVEYYIITSYPSYH